MRRPKIYAAGPDLFLPTAKKISIVKKAIADAAGFELLDPLDNNLGVPPIGDSAALAQWSRRVLIADLDMVYACDGVVANLTPWQGASADVGTCVEVGAAIALGKPVFAYTNDVRDLLTRIREEQDLFCRVDEKGTWFDSHDRMLEFPGNADNLMLDQGVPYAGGYPIYRYDAEGDAGVTRGFEVCIGYAAYTILQATNAKPNAT